VVGVGGSGEEDCARDPVCADRAELIHVVTCGKGDRAEARRAIEAMRWQIMTSKVVSGKVAL
jgi:hypothetical protein